MVSDNGETHSLKSMWGTKVIVKDIKFKPRKDGLDPSGSLDKKIMNFLGLAFSSCNHGYNYLANGHVYIVNTLGSNKVTCHGCGSFTEQLKYGGSVKQRKKAWLQLKDEYEKEQKKNDSQPSVGKKKNRKR